MPISFQWYDDDQTILTIQLMGRWTWDELFTAYDEMLPAIQQAKHKIYGLMLRAQDEHRNYAPPNAFVHSMTMIRRLPPNLAMGIIVDKNSRTLRALHDAIARAYQPYGRKIGMVATIEEALAQIQQAKAREAAKLPEGE